MTYTKKDESEMFYRPPFSDMLELALANNLHVCVLKKKRSA